MKGLKRPAALIVGFSIILQSMFAINATASWQPIGAGQENHWGDEFVKPESKGVLTISDVKFNVESEDSVDVNTSVFNKFTLNYEEYDTLIITETKKPEGAESPYPKLKQINNPTAERYAYKFYNPNANKKNYDIFFWAGFDSELQALVNKGDIQVKTVADTHTYDKKGDIDAGYVNIITNNKNGAEIFRTSAGYGRGHGFHPNVATGWVQLNTSTSFLQEYIESRGGRDGGKNNSAFVQNVRFYLKDSVRPKVQKVEITSTFGSTKTNAGQSKQRAKVGDNITYKVTFDENVIVAGKPQLILNAKNNYNELRADFVQMINANTANFVYTVKDMTSEPEHSLDALAGIKGLVLNGGTIKDKVGNKIETKSNALGEYNDLTGNTYFNSATKQGNTIFINDKLTVDDTYSTIHDTNYTDTQNGYFYPKKTSYYSGNAASQKYTTGSMPSELKEPPAYSGSGDEYNQPTIISANSDAEGAIFRVVLNEEIDKSLLNVESDPLKLKLQLSDRNKNPLNKYVYAALTASRIMNVSVGSPSNGVNTGQTELIFRYKPTLEEFQGMGLTNEVYCIDFAGSYNGNDFVFAQDIFSKQLKNISGLVVEPARLILPSANNVKRSPLNQAVMVDLKGPVLISNNIETAYVSKLKDSTNLTFTEDYGIEKVQLSLVAYKDGQKVKLNSKLPGTSSGNTVIAYAAYDSTDKNYKVDLSGLTITGDIPSNAEGTKNAEIYLEYRATDRAGNITTNADARGIPVKVDTTVPEVNGVKVSIDPADKNTANVKYNVTDRGVGKVSDEIFYKVEEGVSEATPAGNARTVKSNSQNISITGVEGTKKTYQIWASFADILGNRMKSFYPSGPVDIATRSFSLGLSDSAISKVAANHSVTVSANKLPASDYTIKLYYKWVPSGMLDSAVPFKMVEYTPQSFNNGASFVDLSSQTLQKDWMKIITGEEKLFKGEMRFVGYAEMLTAQNGETTVESTQTYIGNTYYFDTTGPVINMTVSGANEGYNSLYTVKLDLSDDGSEYMNGMYTLNGNIGYNKGDPKLPGNAPAFEVLVGSETIPIKGYESIDSSSYKFNLDLSERFKSRSGYEDATEAYLRVTATDLSGNTTVHTFGFGTDSEGKALPVKFDIKSPEIKSIVPIYNEGKLENKDFVKYSGTVQDGRENLYIVRSISDVIKGITTTIQDNVADKMYARYYSGSNIVRTYFSEKVNERSFTVNPSAYSSYEKTYFRGNPSYTFNMFAEDISGNSTSRDISFIEDTNAPNITLVYGMDEGYLTNGNTAPVHVLYASDSYEAREDINVTVSGAGATVNIVETAINHAVINATKNGPMTVTLTDRLGNTVSRTVEVSCFDNILPQTKVLSNDNTAKTPVKYGEITIMTSDDRILNTFETAIVPAGTIPSGDKYFSSKADGKYFGADNDITSVDLGLTGESITAPAGSRDAKKYSLTYVCIPDGTYDVYTRNNDLAGNVNAAKLTTIYCSSAPPKVTGITYSPVTLTGGNVTVNIATDTPTYINENVTSGKDAVGTGNVALMQEGIKKARETGFSYVWEGQLKQLSVTDAVYKYNSICDKIKLEQPLSSEEKYLFKNEYGDFYESFLKYYEIHSYKSPVGDILDFLVNNCFSRFYKNVNDYLLKADPYADPYITMSRYYFDGYSGMDLDGIFNNEVILPLEKAGVFKEFSDIKYQAYDAGFGIYPNVKLDLYSYPMALDTFDIESKGKTIKVDEKGKPVLDVNGNATYSYYFTDNTSTYTDEQVLAALKKLQTARKKVITTVADKYVKYFCNISEGEYSKEHTLNFDYNLNKTLHVTDRSGQTTAFDISVQNIYTDLPHIQKGNITLYQNDSGFMTRIIYPVNADSIDMVIASPDNTGTRFDNYYIFDIRDESGKALKPVGNTVAASVYATVTNSVYGADGAVTGQIYSAAQIRLMDGTILPGLVVLSEGEVTPVPNAPRQAIPVGTDLYRYADVLLTGNGKISFRIIDPTMLTSEKRNMAVGEQFYIVDVFDREAPTAGISYSPQGNTENMVNTDVTVSVVNVSDNKTPTGNIVISNDKGSSDAYTFKENGTVTFTLTDEANNKTNYTVTVDYINRNPVNMTAKFYLTDGTEITDKFDRTEALDKSTEPATKTNKYTYTGSYTNKPITTVIYADGKEYSQQAISDNTSYTVSASVYEDAVKYSYVNKAGTTGYIKIAANKFDNQAPKLVDTVILQKGTFNGTKQVLASFALQDNITSTFDLGNLKCIYMTQRKNNEVITVTDKTLITSYGKNKFGVLFEYNGEAKLVFADEAGNTVDVKIDVSELDKTPPYIQNEVRTSEVTTNRDVSVMLYPSEDVRYRVTSQDGKTILQDWSFEYNRNPAVYTFTKNDVVTVWLEDKDGNSFNKNIDVDYIDKTVPELNFEVIYNKSLTTTNAQELLNKERETNPNTTIYDIQNKLLTDYTGAATIKLTVKNAASNDVFTGAMKESDGKVYDTIAISNRENAVYHTVMQNGSYTFMFTDTAGNANILLVPVTNIDTLPPKATVTGNPLAWVKGSAQITVTPYDTNADSSPKAGGKAYVVVNGVKKDSYTFTADKNAGYQFILVDDSGNSTMTDVNVTRIDNTAPTISYEGSFKDLFYKKGAFTAAEKASFESGVTFADSESGVNLSSKGITYSKYDEIIKTYKAVQSIDPNTPAIYNVTFTVMDNAGNGAELTRRIKILDSTDIIPILNDVELLPNSQITFKQGTLELKVINAENTGNNIIYCFEKGYYNEAQMKGSSFKAAMPASSAVSLVPQEPGMYTLLIQTEDRQSIIVYVFITGTINE